MFLQKSFFLLTIFFASCHGAELTQAITTFDHLPADCVRRIIRFASAMPAPDFDASHNTEQELLAWVKASHEYLYQTHHKKASSFSNCALVNKQCHLLSFQLLHTLYNHHIDVVYKQNRWVLYSTLLAYLKKDSSVENNRYEQWKNDVCLSHEHRKQIAEIRTSIGETNSSYFLAGLYRKTTTETLTLVHFLIPPSIISQETLRTLTTLKPANFLSVYLCTPHVNTSSYTNFHEPEGFKLNNGGLSKTYQLYVTEKKSLPASIDAYCIPILHAMLTTKKKQRIANNTIKSFVQVIDIIDPISHKKIEGAVLYDHLTYVPLSFLKVLLSAENHNLPTLRQKQ